MSQPRIAPKHRRRVEQRAEGREVSQQPDGVENAEQAEVNQREVARPAAKPEKSDCGESDRQESRGSRSVGELPTQVRTRKRNLGLSQEKRGCVGNVQHLGWTCSQVTTQSTSGSKYGALRNARPPDTCREHLSGNTLFPITVLTTLTRPTSLEMLDNPNSHAIRTLASLQSHQNKMARGLSRAISRRLVLVNL